MLSSFIILITAFRLKSDLESALEEWCNNRTATDLKYDVISVWNVSDVTNMTGLFVNLSCNDTFDADINTWDVSEVTNMNAMFSGVSSFNHPLGSWDVSEVTDMSRMFFSATKFNQSLSSWNVSKVKTMEDMFDSTSMSSCNKKLTHDNFATQVPDVWTYAWQNSTCRSFSVSLTDDWPYFIFFIVVGILLGTVLCAGLVRLLTARPLGIASTMNIVGAVRPKSTTVQMGTVESVAESIAESTAEKSFQNHLKK